MMLLNWIKAFFVFFICVIVFVYCNSDKSEKQNSSEHSNQYASLQDTTSYIGMAKCLECHSDKKTFLETGMGKSFGIANASKSIISIIKNTYYYDKFSDFHYRAQLNDNHLRLTEYRLSKSDTSHRLTVDVDYVIGSGHHTNSHLLNRGGYVYQMPFTFYAQKKIMDIPPGFEQGFNSRFSRKIGLECMSCHNALPKFADGSENKFSVVPSGIDCERCHGPGGAHLAQFINGNRTDTANQIDYSIVNPAKLPIDLQFDICQRCHLQGNAVLKEGKSFLDYKPGAKLSDYISVFLPKFENGEDEFIMASHADRLKQSKCFIESYKKGKDNKSIKPYKSALTCITCHNPHVSVTKTDENYFNQKCLNCHKGFTHDAKEIKEFTGLKTRNLNDCVSCHMPNSGSIDIPHVSIHDHYIRKPILNKEKQAIKKFVGLKSINNPKITDKEYIKAYLQQYEKFEKNQYYLDSAYVLLSKYKTSSAFICEWINYYFLRDDFTSIVNFVKQMGLDNLKKILSVKSYDNYHAWTLYRISESFVKLNKSELALIYMERAVKLSPYNLDFNSKLASVYFKLGDLDKAKSVYTFILKEDKEFVLALNGLGYIMLIENKTKDAQKLLAAALKADPDNESVLMNNLSLNLLIGNKPTAQKIFNHLRKKYPQNPKLELIKKEFF
jgi:tetratricopeptide (TPR) repeat protein